ncbi:TRAP transporter small permease [Jannaschia sp. W003]|uniref:TRAP transporter small permease n=1 Tax=Jannaschia sp. W003 TaxID=2867012 RepID=UPI0021A53BDE|nr:TRAP transporter small permease [Jannaschia sp. W003]UWQ21536.1 TRAP transporter small permease [Jannaschia sp. W003]
MHGAMRALARGMALLGGLVLAGLVGLVCLSVLGRTANALLHSDAAQSLAPSLAAALLALGVGPIPGDFEIVEAGTAFAVFAFLPLCQLSGAHASVDVFANRLPPRASRALRAAAEMLFAAVLATIAWQLALGTLAKHRSGQTTFLLQFPFWWAYAASLAGAAASAVVGAYVAWMRLREGAAGRALLPLEAEEGP